MKNRIGWCNLTWNPVWGCNNNCSYCYARKIAKRFYRRMYSYEFNYYAKNTPSWAWTGDYLENLIYFKPTLLISQLEKEFPKRPQKIFVGSMSEIYYWDEAWIEKVIEKIKQYPQHTFQFLTKYPDIYKEWVFPQNCWLGVTITKTPKSGENHRWDFNEFKRVDNNAINLKFINFEPLLEEIYMDTYLNFDKEINWVIIGAETGNRKGKIIPKREWIEAIINYCKYRNIPIYLKENLKEIYPVEIKEFPKTEL